IRKSNFIHTLEDRLHDNDTTTTISSVVAFKQTNTFEGWNGIQDGNHQSSGGTGSNPSHLNTPNVHNLFVLATNFFPYYQNFPHCGICFTPPCLCKNFLAFTIRGSFLETPK